VHAAVRKSVTAKLGVSTSYNTAEEIAAAISASPYAHDYNITFDTIRNLRRKHFDCLWKHAVRDVDSVRLAVCSCLCKCWSLRV
jgi:hypothetical protein